MTTAKVLGVGGVFFKAKDPEALGQWYQKHLGIPIDPSWGGAAFTPDQMPDHGATIWVPFKANTDYFDPANQTHMINLVVDDLHKALTQVKEGGAELVGDTQNFDYGFFGWFLDPEGNKVELWEPKGIASKED